MHGYDQHRMALQNTLDKAFRARLRDADLNQTEAARFIDRNQSWLNRYMHGAGHATIDDVLRLVAFLIGVETPPLSEMERRLLKAWRLIPENRQDDAVVVLENVAKGYRRQLSPESAAPAVRTPPATIRKARGTR